MICERLQTDFWLIVNFRGKNLTALQSQLAITMTCVVASQHPSYMLLFPSQGVLLTYVFPAYLKRRFFASQGIF